MTNALVDDKAVGNDHGMAPVGAILRVQFSHACVFSFSDRQH